MTDRQAILAFALARRGLDLTRIGYLLDRDHESIRVLLKRPLRGYAVPADWTPTVLQQQIDQHLRLANVRGRS